MISPAQKLSVVSNNALLQMLDDLIDQICKSLNLRLERSIRAYQAEIRRADIPLEEKWEQIERFISLVPYDARTPDDTFLRDDFTKKLENIKEEKGNYNEGLKELKELIKQSELQPELKDKITNDINACMNSFEDPYLITGIRPELFVKLRNLAIANDINPSHINYYSLKDGSYAISYTGDNEPIMKQLLQEAAYAIGDISRPTLEQVYAYANGVQDPRDATVTRVQGLSPEMMERMVELGVRSAYTSFAKDEVSDSIVYRTGMHDVSAERFTSSVKMMFESAFDVTCGNGVRKKEINARAKNEKDLEKAVNDAIDGLKPCTVYYAHAYHAKDENGNDIISKNTDVPYIDQKIVINKDSFQRKNNDITYNMTFKNTTPGFDAALNIAIHNHPQTNKVVITEDVEQELKEKAEKLCQEYTPLIANCRTRSEAMQAIKSEIADISASIGQDYKSPDYQAGKERIHDLEALYNGFDKRNYENSKDLSARLSQTEVENAVIAQYVYEQAAPTHHKELDELAEQRLSNWVKEQISSYGEISPSQYGALCEFVKGLDLNSFIIHESNLHLNGDKAVPREVLMKENEMHNNGELEAFIDKAMKEIETVTFSVEAADISHSLDRTFENIQKAMVGLDKKHIQTKAVMENRNQANEINKQIDKTLNRGRERIMDEPTR